MKKKLILIVTIITILSMLTYCLTACGDKNENNNNNSNENNSDSNFAFTTTMTAEEAVKVAQVETDNIGITWEMCYKVNSYETDDGIEVNNGYFVNTVKYSQKSHCSAVFGYLYDAQGNVIESSEDYAYYDVNESKLYYFRVYGGKVNASYEPYSASDYNEEWDEFCEERDEYIEDIYSTDKDGKWYGYALCEYGDGTAEPHAEFSLVIKDSSIIRMCKCGKEYEKVSGINSTIIEIPESVLAYKSTAVPYTENFWD